MVSETNVHESAGIRAEEVGNRAEYESRQAKVWDATVDKAEAMLLEKYGREGNKKTAPAGGVQMSARGRNFSYDELVARDNLVGEVITPAMSAALPVRANGTIDLKAIRNMVKAKCELMPDAKGGDKYYLPVPDIMTYAEITATPITHGFFNASSKKMTPSDKVNALAALYMPEVFENSIEVNRLGPRGNRGVPFSHVLIGVIGVVDNGTTEYYAVRTVIEERSDSSPIMTEYGILGKLYAINAKKIGIPHAQTTSGVAQNQVASGAALTNRNLFEYSVADLLNDVKTDFDDTFSNDVYAHLNMSRRNNPDFGPLQFSARDNGASSRNLTSKDAIDAEIDRLQDEISATYSQEGDIKNDPEYRAAQERLNFAVEFKEKVEARRALKAAKERLGYDGIITRRNELAEEINRLKELRKQYLSVTPITDADYRKLKDAEEEEYSSRMSRRSYRSYDDGMSRESRRDRYAVERGRAYGDDTARKLEEMMDSADDRTSHAIQQALSMIRG